jgi:hypothetical protein
MSAGPSTVEVEVGEDAPGSEAREDGPAGESRQRRRRDGVEVEIAREETKRQLITSVTSIVVVVLYMIFTLLRDRESGVVVVDPDEGGDDWEE